MGPATSNESPLTEEDQDVEVHVHRSSRSAKKSRRRMGSKKKSTQRWSLGIWICVVLSFVGVNCWMIFRLHNSSKVKNSVKVGVAGNTTFPGEQKANFTNYEKDNRPRGLMYTRLLALAAHALAEGEGKPTPRDTWRESLISASSWVPCADRRKWKRSDGNIGYILVSANGGINQQRIAICNAVAVARLLNATLVLPVFLHSSVWKDASQFSDIYQVDHFINVLKEDIRIVKELPMELRSLDLEAIGSLVSDSEVMKEAKPSFYVKKILPILLKNRVVHFVGFGNRLAFDPIPFELQRLRCRCNFHALHFVDKIRKTGALLVERMRRNRSRWEFLEHNLLGPFAVDSNSNERKDRLKSKSKYLAVHLRFEIDMAAYSMCYFGGGKEEEEELDEYRKIHFPALAELKKTKKIPSAAFLRSEGKCPLTPEEAVLLIASLGFKRKTHIYIAGSEIYGGKSRMAALRSLYPNLTTKEDLLSPDEIEPFLNFKSQLAALDFIVCSAADAFAMTDSGSQFSSLIQGYRMYYGEGKRPTIRPNKRRLVSVFEKNRTIEWKSFAHSVAKGTKQIKKVEERPVARSVYRHPRCLECMCSTE